MDTQEVKQKFSPMTQDTKALVLDDVAADLMVRVYPYVLPNTKKGDSFLADNATTISYYTQAGLDTDDLLQDENGNWYFEILPSMTTITALTTEFGTSTYHKELEEIRVFEALANFYPKKLKKDLTAYSRMFNFEFAPLVFSFAEPLNEDKHKRGELPIFLASNIRPAQDSDSSLSFQENIDGLYEISFINLTTLEEQFVNAKVLLTNKLDTSDVNSLVLKLPTNSLLGGIDGRTFINDRLTDLSLKETKKLALINATPITVNDRVEMMFKWFDNKSVLPIHIMKKFESSKTLSSVFKDDSDNWLTDGEDLFTLLKEMILITKLFVNDFSDIHPEDKISDITHASYGAILSSVFLGTKTPSSTYGLKPRPINMLINKAPREIMDALYEAFLNAHPILDQGTLTIFKATVMALSRYVASTNISLGGGVNDFNSIYLPWKLKLFNSLSITREDLDTAAKTKIYDIKEDPLVVFDSHWFEINTGIISPKLQTNMYETQLIQSERNITQPLVPPVLRAMSITSNPGGVNISSDNDLKYNWFIPTSEQSVIDKLYLKDLATKIIEAQEIIINDPSLAIGVDIHPLAKTMYDLVKAKLPSDYVRAASFDAEPQNIKDIFNNLDLDSYIVVEGGRASIASVVGIITDGLIKAGYDLNDLDEVGIAGVNIIDELKVPISDSPTGLSNWKAYNIYEIAYNKTGFRTSNEKNIWHSDQGHAYGGSLAPITKAVNGWMSSIKTSWLWQYASDEANLRLYLNKVAMDLFNQMNKDARDKWSSKSFDMTEADFFRFFSHAQGKVLYTKLTFKINGSNLDVVGLPGGHNAGHPELNFRDDKGNLYHLVGQTTSEIRNMDAIVETEIINKIYVWYPATLHIKLKAGSTQSIDLSVDRKLIFTKDEWQLLIRAMGLAAYEEFPITPIKGEDLGRIEELSVYALWNDNIILTINGIDYDIEAINNSDETVIRQRLLFS